MNIEKNVEDIEEGDYYPHPKGFHEFNGKTYSKVIRIGDANAYQCLNFPPGQRKIITLKGRQEINVPYGEKVIVYVSL